MKQFFLVAFCLLILVLVNCKKEKKTDANSTPVATTGNLSGKIYQYDQFGTLYLGGLNSTSVSVLGFSTMTGNDGTFTLQGLPSGTYTLTVQKNGCGTILLPGISYHITDTNTYRASIADIPTFTISSAYAKDTSWFSGSLPGIYYKAFVGNTNKKASVVAILGKSASINLDDPASYENYAAVSVADSLDFGRFFSYSLLKDTYTFKKDSLLYLKIYPVAAKGASYFSSALNKPVYTAFGTAYPTVFALPVH